MIKEQLTKKINEIEAKKFKTVEDNEKLGKLQEKYKKFCENEFDIKDEFRKEEKEKLHTKEGLANRDFRTFYDEYMNEMDLNSFQKQKKLLQLQLQLESLKKREAHYFTQRISNLLTRIKFGERDKTNVKKDSLMNELFEDYQKLAKSKDAKVLVKLLKLFQGAHDKLIEMNKFEILMKEALVYKIQTLIKDISLIRKRNYGFELNKEVIKRGFSQQTGPVLSINFSEMVVKSKLHLQKQEIERATLDQAQLLTKINLRRNLFENNNSELLDNQAILRIEIKEKKKLNERLKREIKEMGKKKEIEHKIEKNIRFISRIVKYVNLTLEFLNRQKVEAPKSVLSSEEATVNPNDVSNMWDTTFYKNDKEKKSENEKEKKSENEKEGKSTDKEKLKRSFGTFEKSLKAPLDRKLSASVFSGRRSSVYLPGSLFRNQTLLSRSFASNQKLTDVSEMEERNAKLYEVVPRVVKIVNQLMEVRDDWVHQNISLTSIIKDLGDRKNIKHKKYYTLLKELRSKKKQLQLIEKDSDNEEDDVFAQFETFKTQKVLKSLEDISNKEGRIENNSLETIIMTRKLSIFTQGYLWSIMFILRIGNYLQLIDEYSNSKVAPEIMLEVDQACNGAGDNLNAQYFKRFHNMKFMSAIEEVVDLKYLKQHLKDVYRKVFKKKFKTKELKLWSWMMENNKLFSLFYNPPKIENSLIYYAQATNYSIKNCLKHISVEAYEEFSRSFTNIFLSLNSILRKIRKEVNSYNLVRGRVGKYANKKSLVEGYILNPRQIYKNKFDPKMKSDIATRYTNVSEFQSKKTIEGSKSVYGKGNSGGKKKKIVSASKSRSKVVNSKPTPVLSYSKRENLEQIKKLFRNSMKILKAEKVYDPFRNGEMINSENEEETSEYKIANLSPDEYFEYVRERDRKFVVRKEKGISGRISKAKKLVKKLYRPSSMDTASEFKPQELNDLIEKTKILDFLRKKSIWKKNPGRTGHFFDKTSIRPKFRDQYLISWKRKINGKSHREYEKRNKNHRRANSIDFRKKKKKTKNFRASMDNFHIKKKNLFEKKKVKKPIKPKPMKKIKKKAEADVLIKMSLPIVRRPTFEKERNKIMLKLPTAAVIEAPVTVEKFKIEPESHQVAEKLKYNKNKYVPRKRKRKKRMTYTFKPRASATSTTNLFQISKPIVGSKMYSSTTSLGNFGIPNNQLIPNNSGKVLRKNTKFIMTGD